VPVGGQSREVELKNLRFCGFVRPIHEPSSAISTRIMRSGGRQSVTGVTVNRHLGLSRKERRRIRAALHRQRAGESKDARLRGKLAYVHMLNAEQAQALRDRSG
jgi:RNA-directed DNA polymerase